MKMFLAFDEISLVKNKSRSTKRIDFCNVHVCHLTLNQNNSMTVFWVCSGLDLSACPRLHMTLAFTFKRPCMNSKGISRSSHQRCSIKSCVLKNFTKFTGKHLCQRLWRWCFPVNFDKFLRTLFLQNTSGRLLLELIEQT